MSGVRPGVKLHLSDDGVELGAPVVIWSEAPGFARYWVHVYDADHAAHVELVRITQQANTPHPIVKIVEE